MTNSWKHLPFPTEKGQVSRVPPKKFLCRVAYTESTFEQVGGHEGIGVIVKMGPGTSNSAVKVGDRVGIKWLAAICGSCRMLRLLFPFVLIRFQTDNIGSCLFDRTRRCLLQPKDLWILCQ